MAANLNDTYGYYVNGEEILSDETFTVTDPATTEPLAEVAESDEAGVREAIDAAETALESWADYDPVKRGRLLRKLADELDDEVRRLAEIESMEVGRPLSESLGLLSAASGFFEYYAGLTDKIEGETIPVPGERHNYTVREPLGVIGIILPWNGPTLLAARSIPAALACGNTIVIKPAPEAPLAILELTKVMNEVLPDGVFNVVPGDGARTGAALTGSDRLGRVMFTGSRETGSAVMKSAAENIVPVGLELGGKNPSIVFPDATIDRVIEDMMKAYYNAGQVCFAPTRLFIHEEIYDTVLERLTERVREMSVGRGTENADIGPLITKEAQERVANYVDEAVQNGAQVHTGGEIPREEGYFYAPTVLDNVDDDAPISCEEVFGPVITAYPFSTESEAVRRANDVEYGLHAVVWTEKLSRAHRVAGDLEAGSIAVNEYPATFVQSPSGPYKQSGIGREKGQETIEDYTNLKNVSIALADKEDQLLEE